MNSDAICSNETDLQDNSSRIPLTRIFSPMFGLYLSFLNARRVEQQAKRLFAMSDTDLNKIGIAREDIPARLAKLF